MEVLLEIFIEGVVPKTGPSVLFRVTLRREVEGKVDGTDVSWTLRSEDELRMFLSGIRAVCGRMGIQYRESEVPRETKGAGGGSVPAATRPGQVPIPQRGGPHAPHPPDRADWLK